MSKNVEEVQTTSSSKEAIKGHVKETMETLYTIIPGHVTLPVDVAGVLDRVITS